MEKPTSYERYASIRDSNNMRDIDVANATGISRTMFSDWKQGRYQPKVDKLMKIADVLGCPLEALLGIKPKYGYED